MKKLGIALIILSAAMPTYYTFSAGGSMSEFLSRMTSPLALLLLITGVVLSSLKGKKAKA